MGKGMFSNRLRSRLRELLANEQGIALPVAMFAMIASMALAGAAVVASVDTQRGSKRDSGSKSAIAAADAGANVATMRLSRYANTTASTPCVSDSGGTLVSSTPEADGWCPAIAGTVGSAAYSYRVSPVGPAGDAVCDGYDLCIVSTGTIDGVSRRVEMTFNESSLEGGDEEGETGGEETSTGGTSVDGLIGQDGIDISGSVKIYTGIGTNGNVTGSGAAHKVCGDIRVGIGKENSANQCTTGGFKVIKANVDLPPVTSFMPSNIATVNSNNRLRKCISTNNPVDCQKDTYTGKFSSTDPLNGRSISLTGSKSLTVGGSDYWLCTLSLSGSSELIMAAGAKARFFFDTPENCGLSSGATQISISGTSGIVSTGYSATDGRFDVPGFYLLGSTSRTTNVSLNGNHKTGNEFVIYGPNTTMNVSGNTTYKGLIAGKKITISGSAVVENDTGFTLPPELQTPPVQEEEEDEEETPGVRYFTPQTYLECSGIASIAPDDGC
jgi:hypothetical protein